MSSRYMKIKEDSRFQRRKIEDDTKSCPAGGLSKLIVKATVFVLNVHFPTQNVKSANISRDNQCICLQLQGTDTMPRDGGGTENIQTSANEAAVKNKILKFQKLNWK